MGGLGTIVRSGHPVVLARGLSKSYADLRAVDRVDLDIRAGEVYGLLGPNGAGKTTVMRMLLGLVRPDAGELTILDRPVTHRPGDALQVVSGFVETPRFYPYLSARKNLALLARLDGGTTARRIDEVLATVSLTDRADGKVKSFSYGMVQRLGVAAALMRDPDLLVLDEPTNGLDPGGIRDMRSLIHRLREEGITILLSSHDMNEVDEVCTRVAIMRRGRIAFDGPLEELREQADLAERVLDTDDDERALAICHSVRGVTRPVRAGGHLVLDADDATVQRLVEALVIDGIGVRSIHAPTSALETLFFRLTESPEHEVSL